MNGRKSLKWPSVPGKIESATFDSTSMDLLPNIQFSYIVNNIEYRRTIEFARDILPSEEFSKSYVERYPSGTLTEVFYNPEQPEDATLEPGPGNGDWLVFALGFVTTLFGFIFLIVSL